jgi:hypothetical protein
VIIFFAYVARGLHERNPASGMAKLVVGRAATALLARMMSWEEEGI